LESAITATIGPLKGARPNPDGIKHVAQWGTDIHSLIQASNV